MANPERSNKTFRKITAVAGAAALIGGSAFAASGCDESRSTENNPKTDNTVVLTQEEYNKLVAATKPTTLTTVGEITTTSSIETPATSPVELTTTTVSGTTETTVAVAQVEGEGQVIAKAIAVPSVISGSMVRELRDGGVNPMYKEGEWFHPVYDLTQEGKAANYRGIGPWYPVAFENVDPNAAVLTSHGNVGEVIVSGRDGGKIMVAFMQLDKHQHEGAWGTDPKTGKFMQSDKWEMQYNFHSLAPLQELWVVDPDTGANLLWPDGSPVIYRANEQGIAAFAIPATKGNDVRVGFVFEMPAQGNKIQAPEVKIERGPNDRPGLTGENPLPDSVLKPMVSEK